MKIFNTAVYGLNESLIRAGYPHALSVADFPEGCKLPPMDAYNALLRGSTLGHAPAGSGHDCYLKGIIVQMDITAPQYWWMQFQRYHFADIVSSQSKMHCITKMDIESMCNEYVDDIILSRLIALINVYKDAVARKEHKAIIQRAFQRTVANTPMGLKLTAGITTNYLQLKTIFQQRKNHKLEEWEVFCKWIETLPKFSELILK